MTKAYFIILMRRNSLVSSETGCNICLTVEMIYLACIWMSHSQIASRIKLAWESLFLINLHHSLWYTSWLSRRSASPKFAPARNRKQSLLHLANSFCESFFQDCHSLIFIMNITFAALLIVTIVELTTTSYTPCLSQFAVWIRQIDQALSSLPLRLCFD